MHLVRAANGFGRSLGESEVTHLARPHQFGHGANGIFNGNGFINAVLVIQVDHVGAQPLEAGLAGLLHVLRTAVHAQKFALRPAHVAELGGEHDLVTAVFDGAAHQLFVFAGAVHVGRIKERAAEFDGAMNGGDGFLFVACAIEL